ncbi:9590_t:CDS:2 [Acaulospora colombiana]|uniref:9590_t:CDS:1 n=1 Tax=Acaulospora colombiana TaxID=27376 RepID=A0ACA9KAW0_9GLOM|nr:9590_t:CDS:2 [Acaulospora colombiana]
MELLQLQDLNPSEHAAAEKQEARHEVTHEAAPRPRQLKPIPI